MPVRVPIDTPWTTIPATCAFRRSTTTRSSSSATTTSGVFPPTGGTARRLTAGCPSRRHPACRRTDAGSHSSVATSSIPEVYLMPADGGPARRLTWLGPDVIVRGWTPRRDRSSSSRPTVNRSFATIARSRSIRTGECPRCCRSGRSIIFRSDPATRASSDATRRTSRAGSAIAAGLRGTCGSTLRETASSGA